MMLLGLGLRLNKGLGYFWPVQYIYIYILILEYFLIYNIFFVNSRIYNTYTNTIIINT